MNKENIHSIEATREAEEAWYKMVKELSDATLFPQTNSWYMGANIPGKPREQLNFTGGFPKYEEEIAKGLDGFKGFTVVKA